MDLKFNSKINIFRTDFRTVGIVKNLLDSNDKL